MSQTVDRPGNGRDRHALLVVDVQNDFCEGGSLGVEGGAEVAGAINNYVAAHGDDYDLVVGTRDWHIEPGGHFSAEPDFVDSWPHHCVAGTEGAEFHPALGDTPKRFDALISKGRTEAAYSGFDGVDDDDRPLTDVLSQARAGRVTIAGLCTDYCVRQTALDARGEGLGVTVLLPLCAGVAPDSVARTLEELRDVGVALTEHL